MKALRLESDEESEFEDEDIAMIAWKFKRFFKKLGKRRRFKDLKISKREEEGNCLLWMQEAMSYKIGMSSSQQL